MLLTEAAAGHPLAPVTPVRQARLFSDGANHPTKPFITSVHASALLRPVAAIIRTFRHTIRSEPGNAAAATGAAG